MDVVTGPIILGLMIWWFVWSLRAPARELAAARRAAPEGYTSVRFGSNQYYYVPGPRLQRIMNWEKLHNLDLLQGVPDEQGNAYRTRKDGYGVVSCAAPPSPAPQYPPHLIEVTNYWDLTADAPKTVYVTYDEEREWYARQPESKTVAERYEFAEQRAAIEERVAAYIAKRHQDWLRDQKARRDALAN